jgi:hypothetical protein
MCRAQQLVTELRDTGKLTAEHLSETRSIPPEQLDRYYELAKYKVTAVAQ